MANHSTRGHTRADLIARAVTELLAPWVIVVALPFAVAWDVTHTLPATLGWAALVAITSSLLPMALIVWGAHRGRWDGHHVRNRPGRLLPFLALILSNTIGLGLLHTLHAPWPIIALDIAMITSLLVTGAITTRWKISMHTAVAAGAVAVTAHLTPLAWTLVPLVAAIAWSRTRLGDHTTGQTTIGALTGLAIGGGTYTLLIGL